MEPRIDPEFENLIPPISEEENDQLRKNIERDGCRDPLVTWNGILVDGHHRYKICRELGVPFTTVDLDVPSRSMAKIWAIKNQQGRRNLKESQRAMMAAKLADLYGGSARREPGEAAEEPLGDDHANLHDAASKVSEQPRERAARAMNVSVRSVVDATKTIHQGVAELQEAVSSGEVAVSSAVRVATLPPEEQRALVAAGPKAVAKKAKSMRQSRLDMKAKTGEPHAEEKGQEESASFDKNQAVERIHRFLLEERARWPVSQQGRFCPLARKIISDLSKDPEHSKRKSQNAPPSPASKEIISEEPNFWDSEPDEGNVADEEESSEASQA